MGIIGDKMSKECALIYWKNHDEEFFRWDEAIAFMRGRWPNGSIFCADKQHTTLGDGSGDMLPAIRYVYEIYSAKSKHVADAVFIRVTTPGDMPREDLSGNIRDLKVQYSVSYS